MRIFQKQVKQLSDEELMKLLSKGNQKAFDEIYLRYSDVLFGYFMKMLARDKEKCEDMVHDLFAKIIRKPDYFNVNRSFRTWVFSVACNMCKNEYKRMSVRKHVSNDFEPTKSLQAESDTLKKVHESTFSESFYQALNALDEKHKNVFARRHFEGLSMKEISETLEINEGTVKSRLFYATKTLAKELKEFNPIYNQ